MYIYSLNGGIWVDTRTLLMLSGYFLPKHTDAKIFEYSLNPVNLVFIG